LYGEDAAPQSFDELSVRDVMTVDVKVVSPDATVSEAFIVSLADSACAIQCKK